MPATTVGLNVAYAAIGSLLDPASPTTRGTVSRVVCVHGIAQELKAREPLLAEWAPSLAGGVSNAGGTLAESEVDMAFYGSLFREPGAMDGADIPDYRPGDVDDPMELGLLEDIYDALGGDESTALEDGKSLSAQRTVAHMLGFLGTCAVIGEPAQRVVIWLLKQVRRYLSEPRIRNAARQSLLDRIGSDTRVIVAHSLGTVVAFETLCAHPELPVRTLVTLGSPLGMPALLPRLVPVVTPGASQCPPGLVSWVNVADKADIVALRPDLRGVYGDRVSDFVVHNGGTMHNVQPYLTASQTGSAVIRGLAQG